MQVSQMDSGEFEVWKRNRHGEGPWSMLRQFVKVTIAALWPPTWPALGKRVVKNLGGLAKICVIALYLELLLSVPLVMLCITRGAEEEERRRERA